MIGLDTNVLARYYVASPGVPTQLQSTLARQLIESGKQRVLRRRLLRVLQY